MKVPQPDRSCRGIRSLFMIGYAALPWALAPSRRGMQARVLVETHEGAGTTVVVEVPGA